MTILALEFSSDRRSVALARDGVVLAEAAEQTGGRATNAIGLIEQVLAMAKISREEIKVLAVGLGPGSYTGIRAAIAVAQGWQLATGAKTLGVRSVDALAAQAQAAQIFGVVNVLVDAQRGEFYLSTWEISEGERREIEPLKIVGAAVLAEKQAMGERCVGQVEVGPLLPSAAMVAWLAGETVNFLTADALEPVYLRQVSFVKAPPSRVV
jgi:tRNA threonylcarbamoyladenosine biosynthesis protein TsaB